MLTIQDMLALPERYPVEVSALYPGGRPTDNEGRPVRPMNLFIRFTDVAPEFWEWLLTQPCALPAAIEGIHQSDGTLFPEYQERLAAVNEWRKARGAHPIR